MKKEKTIVEKRKSRYKNIIPILAVLIIIAGIPLLLLNYQSRRSGLSTGEVIKRKISKSESGSNKTKNTVENLSGEKIDFLDTVPIGQKFNEPPLISHIQAVDLDDDGLMDVVLSDCRGNFVSWIRQNPAGTFTEKILASDLIAPAHVQIIDFDGDGDKDILVAVLGMLFPNNDKIGSVVILENDGQFNFRKHIIVEKIARVSDVRGGDLDNDGDMDLAVDNLVMMMVKPDGLKTWVTGSSRVILFNIYPGPST